MELQLYKWYIKPYSNVCCAAEPANSKPIVAEKNSLLLASCQGENADFGVSSQGQYFDLGTRLPGSRF